MDDKNIEFDVVLNLKDLSPSFGVLDKYWDKHNQDIAKAERLYKDFGNQTEKAFEKVNRKAKEQMSTVAAEGKAIQQLEKYFDSLAKKNSKAFDSKDLKQFNDILKQVSGNLGGKTDFELDLDDFEVLSKKLSAAKDDFEALNIIVDFFEKKMVDAGDSAAQSLDKIQKNIEETKLNIQYQKDFIKDLENKIEDTGPGKIQAGMISELEAEKNALSSLETELKGYENQLKSVNKENVSLTTQLRRVKDEMVKLELEGGKNSARYDQLKEKADEYNEILQRTNRELRRTASPTEGLDKLIGTVNGVVGLYSAAQGAAALLGDENEEWAKSLVKLNGALALLNGLQAVQVELSKKEAISTRVLTFLRGQYTIATTASATATQRLAAALKLTGVGLLVGGIAALVYYWEDIAEAIGFASERTERLNEINKKANDLYGEQIAELKFLNQTVKEGSLSVEEQKQAVEKFNETQGKTLGTVKDFEELQQRLISSGDDYVEYVKKKALAEAAYQLAVENSKKALEQRGNTEAGFEDYLTSFFTSGVNLVKGEGTQSLAETVAISNEKKAKEFDKQSNKYFELSRQKNKEAIASQKELGIVIDETNQKIGKGYEKLSNLLSDLIKKQRDIKTSLIENDRDREKQVLKDQLQDEKEARAKEIEALEVSQDKKLAVIKAFNKIYNEETGAAYEQLRKNLQEIDDKYDEKLRETKLTALQAIDSVFKTEEENDRQAIKNRFEKIRKTIEEQIDQTKDEVEKQELATILFGLYDAEDKETREFDTGVAQKRLEREKEIAKSTLEILKSNNKNMVNLEKVHQLELLALDEAFYKDKLRIIKDSFEDVAQQDLLKDLTTKLQNSKFLSDIESIKEQLIKAFGEETAAEIIKTVEALNKVQDEIAETSSESLSNKIDGWTRSIESFSDKLTEVLLKKFPNIVAESGITAEEFSKSLATIISATYDSISQFIEGEVLGHQEKVRSLKDSIAEVENQLQREKDLYDQGYANNYQARQAELDLLKEQKRQEEEELQKSLKRKAALQKAELLTDAVGQINNLITASSNIFKWASEIPFVGIPLAIGLIATMFGAFAASKVQAYQAIGNVPTYRTGLQKGRVHLSGPSHEESGFGVHNSKTGEKVAEFENNEDVYVLNPAQQKAYNHLMDMIIADARGEKDLRTSINNHYKIPKMGKTIMQVVERVNTITEKSHTSREQAAKENESVIKEIKDFKEKFTEEFKGYKKERDEEITSWETKEYFYVKQGNTIKKYKKEQ